MKVRYQDSLKFKIEQRLKSLSEHVVLRADFEDLGGYRQVSAALKALVAEKRLVRIGLGIYAKTYISSYTNKPAIEGGFVAASREALARLGVQWEPSSAEQAYNAGKITQIPATNTVKLKKRCRRKIAFGNNYLSYERNINAR